MSESRYCAQCEEHTRRIAALEAEVDEMTSVLALLRLHRTRHPDEPIPSELLNREYGLLCDQGDPELEAKEGDHE